MSFSIKATCVAALSLGCQFLPAQRHWVATWAAAPVEAKADGLLSTPITLREVVHISIGGKQLRLRLSNEFGTEPLSISAVSVAESQAQPGGRLKGPVALATFHDKPSVVIAPGTAVESDDVRFDVRSLENLAISLSLPVQPMTHLTRHDASHGTNYIAPGTQASETVLAQSKTDKHWTFLEGVSVLAPADVGSLVCIGDSITDGTGSTDDLNDRWTDDLSAWLQSQGGARRVGLVNAGIGGNRILHDGNGPSALSRFSRDVLQQDGVRAVILLEGINDISHTNAAFPDTYLPVSSDDLISGMKEMISEAHAHGLKIYGATITPYLGAKYYWTGGDAIRRAVNKWILESKAFDKVIDFDQVLAQPDHADALAPAYEHGDHLHPSPAGYRVMATTVEQALFTSAQAPVLPRAHESKP